MTTDNEALAEATRARDALKAWLLTKAYPLWWTVGYDHQRGGFQEKLDVDGSPVDAPRRARVQPRQVFAYAVAGELGWKGPWRKAVQGGLDWYLEHYTRPDGLFRTLVAADGTPLDDKVDLYDQAFGLFALATAYGALDQPPELANRAAALRDRLKAELDHPVAGFEESHPRTLPLLSNPHMHMFEASLAWAESDGGDADGKWRALADEIAELALSKFIDPKSGGLREFFDGDWNPAPGIEGRIVEPGHQFEWAWLLLRWAKIAARPDAAAAARRLIEIGEGPGVDPARGVAMNQLLDDMSVHDASARLWPQTERIKAFAQLATESAAADDWRGATRGVRGLMKYFSSDLAPGLWRDKYQPDGTFVQEPAPASSFYHIVCAVLVLDRAVKAAGA
ncbi:MAG: mannose-6-phosphate isomerase [Caulobacterales bacterium 68-7]|nr:MAG: mannose-6-phosphate isomerase [Caulobacterales bacterium 68-7]